MFRLSKLLHNSLLLSTFIVILMVCIPFSQASAHSLSSAGSTATSTNWPQFGFNAANTRFNNKETTLSTSNVSQLTQAWSKSAGTGYGITAPAVVKGVVYITNGSYLYAFKATTGKLLWSINTNATNGLAAPAVANNLIYLGIGTSTGASLNAYSTTNGALVWQTPTPNDVPYNNPTIANGVVYVGGNSLYAFNATSGALLWTGDIHYDDYAPAVVNGIVYEDTYFGEVAAFNASGCTPTSPCEPIWTAHTSNYIYYNAEPVVANGIVYVTCTDDKLYAFKAATGKLLWTAATGGEIISSPAYANGVVYAGSTDGKLYAFNATKGTTLWTTTSYNVYGSSPAVANGVVYTGSNSPYIYAFNASSGVQLWSATAGPSSLTSVNSPVISNGVVYVSISITDTGSKMQAYKLPA